MMGIVLFTGQQTKIMQMNMLQWSRFERLRKEIKVSRVSLIINWILVCFIVADVIIVVFFAVQMNIQYTEKLFSSFIESFAVGGYY